MSLVRFSYGAHPMEELKDKIRHTYDLHKLLQNTELEEFFWSSSFERLMITVAQDDVTSFKNNNDWLVHHPKDAVISQIFQPSGQNYGQHIKMISQIWFMGNFQMKQTCMKHC